MFVSCCNIVGVTRQQKGKAFAARAVRPCFLERSRGKLPPKILKTSASNGCSSKSVKQYMNIQYVGSSASYLAKEHRIFRVMESLPQTHLDTILFPTKRALTTDCSSSPFSYMYAMFKVFLRRNNPTAQHATFNHVHNTA